MPGPSKILSRWDGLLGCQAQEGVRPSMHAVGYIFVCWRMHSKALRKSPIKGGTFASVSQSAFDSRVVNNPGPS